MSTRLLNNIALGTVAFLFLASIGLVVTSLGNQGSNQAQVDLTLRQQTLIQDLNREVDDLSEADNLLAIQSRRRRTHPEQSLQATLLLESVLRTRGPTSLHHRLLDEALASIRIFGEGGRDLESLARFVVERGY